MEIVKKAHLLYHKNTDTTWANCKDWEERRKKEVISYGTIELEINNIFEMKKRMEKDGYVMVKKDPFPMLRELERG